MYAPNPRWWLEKVYIYLDLGLFTTKSLCEYNPEHPVEVRNQVNQPPDENWGGQGGPAGSSGASDYAYQCWPCGSSKSMSTITKYAQYQVKQAQDFFQKCKSFLIALKLNFNSFAWWICRPVIWLSERPFHAWLLEFYVIQIALIQNWSLIQFFKVEPNVRQNCSHLHFKF